MGCREGWVHGNGVAPVNGATPKEASRNCPVLWCEMKLSFLMAHSEHASPFCTRVLASMRSVMWTGSQTSDFGGLQGIAFPVKGSAMAQRPGHWEVDMATWHWSIQSAKAPSSPAHRLSPPQHGLATLPESTNEGLVRARTTIPQRLWWGRI